MYSGYSAVIPLLTILDIDNITAPAALVAEIHRAIPECLAAAGGTWNPVGE